MLEVEEGFGCDVMRMRAKDGVQGHWSTTGPWPGHSPALGLVGGVAANPCVVEEGLSASRALDRHGDEVAFWSEKVEEGVGIMRISVGVGEKVFLIE